SGSLALIHFRETTRVVHTSRVREQPKDLYWDLAEAAWVLAEDDEAPAQPDYVADDPELADSSAD
ncbi:MAG TPA: hypothetical protein VEL02_06900, partial [Jatrophihabitantaceae bacterium]|nr:hypothetical protein [Jatrophihabitantaceae bacterium]